MLGSDSTGYALLTSTGLAQSATSLTGLQAVTPNSHAVLYSISPNPITLSEHQGTANFTITRTDASQQATVFVSTVTDQGTGNPGNVYYSGLLNKQVTFAPGALTAPVQFTINDLGLTSGAESFRLIVQKNSTDPFTTSLASDIFTIVNDDPVPVSSYTITPSAPPLNEKSGTVTFTVTRTNFAQAATVYASTVHDQGTDNLGGTQFYNGLLNQKVVFAAGSPTATVQLTINDAGLLAGSESFRLIVQQHATDAITNFLATDTFTIVNNDTGIVANASINKSVNTNVLLSPFLSLPPTPSGVSISLVNFINTHTGPGQLTNGGTPTSGNIAVAYANIGQVGFATGSVTGSDKIEMYASYSNGTVSNTVDLTVNIQSLAAPTPPPQTSSGPVVNSSVQPLQVNVGQSGTLSSSNLSASDSAYPDPSQVTYNIIGYPTMGAILNGGQLAHSFTQADVNAGRVTYQSSQQNGVTSELTDSFSYVVSDPSFRQSATTTATLKIEPLPPPPAGSQPYVDTNSFQTVPEGGQIFVTGNRFSVQNLHVTDPNPNIPSIYTGSSKDMIIVYTVVQGPSHGQLVWMTNYPSLWFGGPPLFGQPVTQFTQNDLNNGWFAYENNFTSGAADSFTFTVSDGFGGTIGLTTAHIPIQPVNPLLLRVNAGAFVTPGGQSTITPDWLRAEDNAPNAYPGDNVVFKVVQGPAHGTLLVGGQAASTFTMLDIDRSLVTYQQNGGAASSDQITLAIASDAYGNTVPDFTVAVTIAATALDKNTGGVAGLGQPLTIGGANLHVAGPGFGSGNPYTDPPTSYVYTITKMPVHGTLAVNGSLLALGGQFTQAQIDNNQLVYTEDGSAVSTDSFNFSISDISFHNNFGSSSFNISITNANGGRLFSGGATPDIFYSGPGNNWVSGGSGTTVSYALAPASVAVNLAAGNASNGFGGTDTLVNIHTVIGSSYGDTFIAGPGSNLFVGGAGNNSITGGSGSTTAAYSGALSDYVITMASASSILITDTRAGSPDGSDNVTNVNSFSFSDNTYTLNQIPIRLDGLGSTRTRSRRQQLLF